LNINSKISLVGLAIIASVIVSPFVYAAVEPHIILVMDSAQTTSPFTIQNNTGADIFEIDTQGAINGVHHFTIVTGESNVYTVTASDDFNDPVIVQEWVFVGKGVYPSSEYYIISLDPVVSVIGQRDSGVGNCHFGWYSDVAGTWDSRTTNSLSFASYDHATTSTGEGWLNQDSDSIAFILFNSDGATTCSFKSMVATMDVVIPLDMEIYNTQ
jgi:hypothetical protein